MDREPLAAFLSQAGYELRSFEALAGDVSPRRYARLELVSGEGAIAAAYPEETGDACSRFERSTALLEQVGVRVPRVLASDCESGFMLLEDLGPETLFDRLASEPERTLPHFERALEAARRIATLDRHLVAELNPPLDETLLIRELRQTIDLYLGPKGLLGNDETTRRGATRALERLCSALGGAEVVPCHRDFMARNLIPKAGEIAVLDHQDLRLGPPAYDLASLLNDSFFPSADEEAALLEAARPSSGSRAEYHRAALQRTLKAIGTFAAFAQRGSKRHLPLIPPTLQRALLHLAQVPEMADMRRALEPLWARHLARS